VLGKIHEQPFCPGAKEKAAGFFNDRHIKGTSISFEKENGL
jgi:hypothetical protein